MQDKLDRLIHLVPPPRHPNDNKGDWAQIEAETNLKFPEDYKRFIGIYGTGTFCGIMEIDSPFCAARVWGSIQERYHKGTALFKMLDEIGGLVSYPHYPTVPGLLACATFGSDLLGWYTDENPESWFMIYRSRTGEYFELPEFGFVDFLFGAITGEIPIDRPFFDPIRQEDYRPYLPH